MRMRTLPVLLAACFTLALSAAAPAVGAADVEVQLPAAAPVDLDALTPAPSTDPSPALACSAASMVEPTFLAKPAPQTCEECEADCDADYVRCEDRCHNRACHLDCVTKYYICMDKCPC